MAAESPKLHVNDLNDDCLVHIFTFLPMRERVRIERVCKRWFNVSPLARNFAEELTFHSCWSWRSCLRNNSNSKIRGNWLVYVENEMDAMKIVKYLKYAGRSLRKLYVRDINWTESYFQPYDYILTVMTKYCPNITSLSLESLVLQETDLRILAENCTQLEELSITVYLYYDHEREPLIKLFQNNCNLRQLSLMPGIDCDFNHELNYLSKKSIESVSFTGTSLEWAIGCERLQYVELHFAYNSCYSDVRLVACTTLQHLEICPENGYRSLRYRDLEFCGSWKSHFRNLQSLTLGLDRRDCETDLYPLITIIVQNCRNIRAVHGSGDSLTDDGLAALASLPLLEYLSISCSLRIRGNKLGRLQNIKHVYFHSCEELEFENLARCITLSPTLETLSISGDCRHSQIFDLSVSAEECAKNRTNNVTLQLNYDLFWSEVKLRDTSFLQVRRMDSSEMCALGNEYFS